MTTAIDIGTGASNLDSSTVQRDGYTYLDYNNAANATGRLSKFEVYADAATMYNVRFGTFSYSSGTTFTPRAWTGVLGNATSGQKTTFTPSGFGLEVSSGDYLAIYWETSGALSYNATGGSGLYRYVGRPTSSQSFTLAGAAFKGAIYASGITPPANATNFNVTGYEDKLTLTWTKSADATHYLWNVDGGDFSLSGNVNTVDDTTSDLGSWGAFSIPQVGASDGTSTAHVALSMSGEGVTEAEHSYELLAIVASDNVIVVATGGNLTDTAFRASSTVNFQFQRYDSGWVNIGSNSTSETYNDTDAPAPVITPGTAAASDGTFNFKVTCANSGESIENGATKNYRFIQSNAYMSNSTSLEDTGYRVKGTISYQWQISAADSDADYSDISGATSSTLTFYDAPAGVGRYYRCKITASNSTTQYSTAERGYRVLLTPTVII